MTAGYPHLVHYNPGDGVAKTLGITLTAFAKYGIQPLAFTNCMNFGSPENKYVMHDFKEVMQTFDDNAVYYDIPIISGNVSFYNETDYEPIMPTPVFGAVGLIEDVYNV
jgi:phosphoribosylformylglycinamidine synthase